MKKYTSVFGMIVRHSFFQIIMIMIGMVFVEVYLFLNAIHKMLMQHGGFSFGLESDASMKLLSPMDTNAMQEMLAEFEAYPIINFELAIENSHIMWIFFLAMLLITVSCCMTGCHFGSHQGYTLQRLQIKEKHIFLLQFIYNTLCYVILWSIQIIVIYVLGTYYVNHMVGTTNQTIFLAFYRNAFLHNLFPMEEWLKWGKLIASILGLGILSAVFPYKQRNGKFGVEIVIMLAIICIWFPSKMANYYVDALVIVWAVGLIAIICWQIWYREKEVKKE